MMATKNFYGEIGGESIQKLYRFLDPSLKTYEERLAQANKVYYEDEECTKLREIWLTVFDDDRIKTNINSTDSVMSETNVCKFQEAVCTYLLFADDVKNMRDENDEKVIVYDNIRMSKGESRNQSLDALLESEDSDMTHVLLVERNETNYKKQIKQVLYKDDYQDNEIGRILTCYRNLYEAINGEIAEQREIAESEDEDNSSKSRARGIIRRFNNIKSELDYDMIQTKEQIKKPIYFKAIAPTSSGDPEDFIDMENFDYWDKSLIRLLSQLTNPSTEYGEQYLGKFEDAYSKVMHEVDEADIEFFEAYRNGKTDIYIRELTDKHGVDKRTAYKRIAYMIDLVQRQMIEDYELDVYYTEKVRGNWKKCSKCGESYPRNEYYWNKAKTGKDGFRGECKKCEAKRLKK